MLRTILYIACFTFLSFSSFSQFKTGCLLEKVDTNLINKTNFPSTRGGLPSSSSLKYYAPPVMSQGSLGSCTAWATAYAGFTIVQRLEHNDANFPSFSPLDLFNRLKTQEDETPCSDGSYINKALELLQENGCAKFSDVENTCKYQSAYNSYNNKLFEYEELNLSSYNIKYALSEQYPVIISMNYYNNGWGNTSNHYNGVWNGNNDGVVAGHHAMCIIGYDDNNAGGAFLVMNSWGSDWGQNGFFWIKYTDLVHLNNAYAMKPNSSGQYDEEEIIENDDDILIEETSQVFRLYNECSLTAYLALGKYIDGQWVSEGWYAAQPNSYVDVEIGNRDTDNIYWMAYNSSNNIWWYDNVNGTDFCYDPVNRFEIYDNESPSCPAYKKFYEDSPGFVNQIYSRNISCPNVSTRDGEIKLAPNLSDLKLDTRSKDTANFNWNQGTLLFDFYSGKIINPVIESEKYIYTVFYISNKNKIIKKTCAEEALTKLTGYKFISKENAERWLSENKK